MIGGGDGHEFEACCGQLVEDLNGVNRVSRGQCSRDGLEGSDNGSTLMLY